MSEYSNCWRLEAPNKILQITLSSSSCLSYETASLFFWYKMMIRGVLINPKKKKCFITNDSVICLYNIVIVKNYILFITYLFMYKIMSLMIFYQNYLKYLQHKLLFKNIKQLRTHILPHFKISWYFKYHF